MSKLNPIVLYGAVGVSLAIVVGYLIYRQKNSQYAGFGLLGFLGNTADAASAGGLSKAGETLGGFVYDVTHSDPTNVTYAVVFPDGSRHAVNAEDIDKSGYFTYAGVQYQLRVSTNDVKYAVAS